MDSGTIITKGTLKEYEQLPEGTRAELIGGMIIMEHAAPYADHQNIAFTIGRRIGNLIETGSVQGMLIMSPMDVYLNNSIIVQPGLIFISEKNLGIIKGHVHGVPDLLIEILSPSNMSHDLITKFKIYEANGVKEYFIINPGDKLVICYRLINNSYLEIYRECGIIKSEVMNTAINF